MQAAGEYPKIACEVLRLRFHEGVCVCVVCVCGIGVGIP